MTIASLFRALGAIAFGWLLLLGPAALDGGLGAALLPLARWAGLSLGIAVIAYGLYRKGARRRRSGEGTTPVEIEGDPEIFVPGVGLALFSVGATLLLAQVGRGPASGGIVFGLLLAAAGAALLLRIYLRIDASRTLRRGWHLFGIPFGVAPVPVPRDPRIRLAPRITTYQGYRRVAFETSLDGPEKGEQRRLAIQGSHTEARGLADRLAAGLGARLVDSGVPEEPPLPPPAPGEGLRRALGALSRLPTLVILAALIAIAVLWLVPAWRSGPCRFALAPDTAVFRFASQPALRIFAARQLARDLSDENVLALVRLVNTVDPGDEPELFDAGLSTLLGMAGEPEGGGGTLQGQVGFVNAWAARRLGRALDANGGILDWWAVNGEVRQRIETLAGGDAEAAAKAWEELGPVDFASTEDFLYFAGPALADRRPVRFVLRPGPRAPEAVAGAAGEESLAGTVGEALALSLWRYQGVGDQHFPQDFWAWWSGYAREHHLPPVHAP
jgi:hypothetical protein